MDLQLKKYKRNEIIYHMEDIPQAIGIVKEGSVVIETVDFITTIEELPKENRPYIILVTSTAKHPFAKKVDQVVLIPYLMQFDTINPLTAPQTIQIVFSLFLIQKIYNEKSKLESK